MRSNRKYIASKLLKTRILLRNKELEMHVPKTSPFTPDRLSIMLDQYGMVYVKPDAGSQGIGVMRVEKREDFYHYQSGMREHAFTSFQKLIQSLHQRMGSKRYLIQQGIDVLRLEERPFDFRVMIQRNPSSVWETTGIAGRVAHPRKAVTNGSQGGTIYSAKDLMEPIAGKEKTSLLLQQMDQLAERTAQQLSHSYPAMNELGLDIAVDHDLKPWILEVNTRPDPCPFAKLHDPAMIKKIIEYAHAYGRRYALTCSKAKKSPIKT